MNSDLSQSIDYLRHAQFQTRQDNPLPIADPLLPLIHSSPTYPENQTVSLTVTLLFFARRHDVAPAQIASLPESGSVLTRDDHTL
jgi:hypothetical protein